MFSVTKLARLGVVFAAIGIRAVGQDAVPPVYLTHAIIYYSAETCEALKASPLIRDEFSAFREATTEVNGGAVGYTGLLLRGLHTYFEIFKTGPSEIWHKVVLPGHISLNMLTDHRTQLPLIRDRLSGAFMRTTRDAQNQPWYDAVETPWTPAQAVGSRVTGRYPDGVTRSNRRYEPGRLLQDLISCKVTVSAAEREQLVANFRAYGYTVREEGEQIIASGPEFTLTMLKERQNEPRIASFEVTLNREKEGEQNYRMGSSELRFEGRKATLQFTFPR